MKRLLLFTTSIVFIPSLCMDNNQYILQTIKIFQDVAAREHKQFEDALAHQYTTQVAQVLKAITAKNTKQLEAALTAICDNALLNAQDKQGLTPLHYAVSTCNSV